MISALFEMLFDAGSFTSASSLSGAVILYLFTFHYSLFSFLLQNYTFYSRKRRKSAKNLHIPKKVRTFAPAFGQKGQC